MVIFTTNRVIIGLSSLFVILLIVASGISIQKGFIQVGKPQLYNEGEALPLWVNKATSVHSPIPYRYHDLPLCSPQSDQLKFKTETLGEIITGNRIESSLYELVPKEFKPSGCKLLCIKKLSPKDVLTLRDLIKDQYLGQWEIDSLPAAVRMMTSNGEKVYETGFPLGGISTTGTETEYELFNHVRISINYNKPSPDSSQYRVILVEVHPLSIQYEKATEEVVKESCKTSKNPLKLQETTTDIDVAFSYEVEWIETDVSWENRWNYYLQLHSGSEKIHWFSIINSIVIIAFLSGSVAMIMSRTIRRDLAKYLEDKDEVEETGWKLVRTEVFRAPQHSLFFSALVGSGVQVFFMSVVSIVFGVLGFVSPSNAGSFTTAALVLYVWMGVVAGYASSRIYQLFSGEQNTRQILVTALLFPGIIFTITFFLNCFLWYKGSSGAFPFTTMLSIMALWFCISVPLCFLGGRLALRKEPIKLPGTVNHIPRQIPTTKWYLNPYLSIIAGGILPFGAVFIEVFFIMTSIWLHRYYALFGFLFLVFLILIITCAEVAIVLCYFNLCNEDWQWWWRSFLTPATSALYLFLYSIYYYATKLELDAGVPSLLYFGYTFILCLLFFVLTGVIGFYSSFWFVRKIYQVIHQD